MKHVVSCTVGYNFMRYTFCTLKCQATITQARYEQDSIVQRLMGLPQTQKDRVPGGALVEI